ncbi:hypothetical protein EON79_17260 [bacterium]|nr:MAG: hypothetical protein EON79_17260 [bacterium]
MPRVSKRPSSPNPMFALVSWRGLALSVGCLLVAPFALFVGRDQIPAPLAAALPVVAYLYLARELILWADLWTVRWLGIVWSFIALICLIGSAFAFLPVFGFSRPLL